MFVDNTWQTALAQTVWLCLNIINNVLLVLQSTKESDYCCHINHSYICVCDDLCVCLCVSLCLPIYELFIHIHEYM